MRTLFEQIGDKISSWLKERDMTQTSFAESIGVSKQVMSKIVNGKKALNVEEMCRIAKTMGVSVEELISETVPEPIIHEPVLFMMGTLENEDTKEHLQFLNHVMNEMISLEKTIVS